MRVQCETTLRVKGEMFSLRLVEVVAVLGTWDPVSQQELAWSRQLL